MLLEIEYTWLIFEKFSTTQFRENLFCWSRVVPCNTGIHRHPAISTHRHDKARSRLSQFCERSLTRRDLNIKILDVLMKSCLSDTTAHNCRGVTAVTTVGTPLATKCTVIGHYSKICCSFAYCHQLIMQRLWQRKTQCHNRGLGPANWFIFTPRQLGVPSNLRSAINLHYVWIMGTAVAPWLRCCATNRKVAGSIPDGVIGIFHWHNPPDRTMALGSIQPLTETSTRRISWG